LNGGAPNPKADPPLVGVRPPPEAPKPPPEAPKPPPDANAGAPLFIDEGAALLVLSKPSPVAAIAEDVVEKPYEFKFVTPLLGGATAPSVVDVDGPSINAPAPPVFLFAEILTVNPVVALVDEVFLLNNNPKAEPAAPVEQPELEALLNALPPNTGKPEEPALDELAIAGAMLFVPIPLFVPPVTW